MKCPNCNEEIAEYATVHSAEPWTATNPFEGLLAWGPYSEPKELLHTTGQIAHIRFSDGTHRLGRMLHAANTELRHGAKTKSV